ncbi:MAG TPA: aldo/keto reductase, partial [candidate division Zixibacteria bacterium]|nr:aldo/keto reductase [candidate division Zixibacteria bacterium]
PEVVRASYELGVRYFDTAARYQNGRNEEMVGAVIRQLGVRDKVVISTKEILPGRREGDGAGAVKRKLVEQCEASLKRLGMETVDILYLHGVSSPEEMKEAGALEALAELKKQGKVPAVGVSTHQNMAAVLKAAAEGGFYDVVLTVINVSLADDADLLGAIAAAARAGVGVVAMKTQAGGARLPNPATLKDYAGGTIATASLKWVLRNEHIASAIPGYDNFQHMEEDFSVARGLDYTAEEAKFLSDNRLTLGLAFCRQCRRCEPSCPHRADIPALMRTHMYAAQYANFEEARATLGEIAPGRGLHACGACERCAARCAHAVDIPGRIERLKTIYA